MRSMKTPEERIKEFDVWLAKKGKRYVELQQEKMSKISKGKDCSKEEAAMARIDLEISQKKARHERILNNIYARMYNAGCSTKAKEERKERTHHLCNLGGLVEKAGLGKMEPDALLGMLIQQAEYMANNPAIVSRWAEKGNAALNPPEDWPLDKEGGKP